MSTEDSIITAVARAAEAGQSNGFQNDLLAMVKVFSQALKSKLGATDDAGLMVAGGLARNGTSLGMGVVLTLQDRILIGWMKGFLRKPVIETVELAAITDVSRAIKPPAGRVAKDAQLIKFRTGEEWELTCSPELPDQAPLFDLFTGILNGSLAPSELPAAN